MANFPSSLPAFAGFTGSHTLLTDNHDAQHNLEQAEVVNIATKIGTGSSTPTNNKVLRGNGTGTSVWAQTDLTTDVTGILPVANGGTGQNTIAGFIANAYPVGCIYTETTGVNPNTTFGFGTWAVFGAGRVLLGNGTSDQVFTAGATGGESNHALTTAELASHTHGITDPGHVHAFTTVYNNSDTPTTGASNGMRLNASSNTNFTISSATTGISADAAGSGNTHNNLPPYLVVYFWKRTA